MTTNSNLGQGLAGLFLVLINFAASGLILYFAAKHVGLYPTVAQAFMVYTTFWILHPGSGAVADSQAYEDLARGETNPGDLKLLVGGLRCAVRVAGAFLLWVSL